MFDLPESSDRPARSLIIDPTRPYPLLLDIENALRSFLPYELADTSADKEQHTLGRGAEEL